MRTSSTRKGGVWKRRPVDIITDNCVETVIFGITDIPSLQLQCPTAKYGRVI